MKKFAAKNTFDTVTRPLCLAVLLASAGGVAASGAGNHGPTTLALPVEQIEHIIQAEGSPANGTLDIGIDRDDIGPVQALAGQKWTPNFEINGDLFFQPLSGNKAFLNGDMPLKQPEVNPFIAKLRENHLVFQAFHQHTPSEPQVWFVHFRGTGDPLDLARSIKAALDVTSTPFPQIPPKHPHTPLNPELLGNILHGDASVDGAGVVTVWILRKDHIVIDGVTVNPQANISTNVDFRPRGGSEAEVVSDFSMTSEESDPVISLMQDQLGWTQGCLYNQETDEHPQLYFDHMLKNGDAYELAHEIRRGLDLTAAE